MQPSQASGGLIFKLFRKLTTELLSAKFSQISNQYQYRILLDFLKLRNSARYAIPIYILTYMTSGSFFQEISELCDDRGHAALVQG